MRISLLDGLYALPLGSLVIKSVSLTGTFTHLAYPTELTSMIPKSIYSIQFETVALIFGDKPLNTKTCLL